jgi:hypothetical protein
MDGIWFVLRSAAEGFERHPTAGRPRSEKTPKFSRTKVSTQHKKP